jgi:hypothetical protein
MADQARRGVLKGAAAVGAFAQVGSAAAHSLGQAKKLDSEPVPRRLPECGDAS